MSGHEHSTKNLFFSYVIGFIVSLALTFFSFGFVAFQVFDSRVLVFILPFLAVIQFVVQLIFFLHLGSKDQESSWNTMTFIFSCIVILILVIGSLWIMSNLNENMM